MRESRLTFLLTLRHVKMWIKLRYGKRQWVSQGPNYLNYGSCSDREYDPAGCTMGFPPSMLLSRPPTPPQWSNGTLEDIMYVIRRRNCFFAYQTCARRQFVERIALSHGIARLDESVDSTIACGAGKTELGLRDFAYLPLLMDSSHGRRYFQVLSLFQSRGDGCGARFCDRATLLLVMSWDVVGRY